jgi:hypothetical protein
MKQTFISWNPSKKTLPLLITINDIIEDYQGQGYTLTIRQLYYQLVARDIIPNSIREYHKIVTTVSKARLAGIVDWSAIEDRVRVTKSNSHWDSPESILRTAANSYYKDRWENQHIHLEVWSEKDAVSGIIEPVCRKLDVTFMANRGYSSQSALYSAYQRFDSMLCRGKSIVILYLGDHDPSGMDMGRDIQDRMGLFLEQTLYAEGLDSDCFKFERIALNLEQINKYNPPENPAKATDSRFKAYASKFGTKSWELDALEPPVLSELVKSSIEFYVDWEVFEEVERIEEEEREKIIKASQNL